MMANKMVTSLLFLTDVSKSELVSSRLTVSDSTLTCILVKSGTAKGASFLGGYDSACESCGVRLVFNQQMHCFF